MASIQNDPTTARIAGISLETYVELHKALTKGHGNHVAQFNSMEEAWFKNKDLQQLLAMHGLTDGARKKKDLLSKMQGMELYAPIPDFSNPLQTGSLEGNKNNSPQDNAEHQQQQGLDSQKASTQQPAARTGGKATNKAAGNSTSNHDSKQPRITAFFPTPTPAKQPTPSRGIEDITAADLAVLGWCDVNEDVEAALRKPAIRFQVLSMNKPDLLIRGHQEHLAQQQQHHTVQQQQKQQQCHQQQQQQWLQRPDNSQSTSILQHLKEPCNAIQGQQLHLQGVMQPSQSADVALDSQQMLFTQPAPVITADQDIQHHVSATLQKHGLSKQVQSDTAVHRMGAAVNNCGMNVSAAADSGPAFTANPTHMMPSAHMHMPSVKHTLAYAMQWLPQQQQQQQQQQMHRTGHSQTYSGTAPHSLTQQHNSHVMPTQAMPVNVAAFSTQAKPTTNRTTEGAVAGCLAAAPGEDDQAGSLKWLAAEVLKFSQEAGVTVSNEHVEPCKLLGRRVGFLLLNPLDHLGKGGRVEGTLPAGLHQGAVVRRIGSSCKPDLCDASCQGYHEWCSVRVMTHLSRPNTRLELTLDLSPSHRLTDLNQILGLAGHHTRLQDAWLLLQIRAVGQPDTDDDDDDTTSIGSRGTASRGAMKTGRGRGRKRAAPV